MLCVKVSQRNPFLRLCLFSLWQWPCRVLQIFLYLQFSKTILGRFEDVLASAQMLSLWNKGFFFFLISLAHFKL